MTEKTVGGLVVKHVVSPAGRLVEAKIAPGMMKPERLAGKMAEKLLVKLVVKLAVEKMAVEIGFDEKLARVVLSDVGIPECLLPSHLHPCYHRLLMKHMLDIQASSRLSNSHHHKAISNHPEYAYSQR